MDRINVVFQVMDQTQEKPSWHNSKIVKVLRNVKKGIDVEPFLIDLSEQYPDQIIRIARLNTDETISVEQANRHDGGYWQAR
jgi:hypothetical protein